MLYLIIILLIINILYNIWITSVLHNMVQGLYHREEDVETHDIYYMRSGPD